MSRIELIGGLIAVVLALGGGGYFLWSIYHSGVQHERTKHVIEASHDAVNASEANVKTAQAVAEATDGLLRDNTRLETELTNARRALARFRSTPPAPGTVGPTAMVDPTYGRAVLCRIERLRGDDAGPACRDAAAHGIDVNAEDEPVHQGDAASR